MWGRATHVCSLKEENDINLIVSGGLMKIKNYRTDVFKQKEYKGKLLKCLIFYEFLCENKCT